MSFWSAAVVIVAILAIVKVFQIRAGIVKDEDGNESYIGHMRRSDEAARRAEAELAAQNSEIEQLRKRVKVLERIATDSHSSQTRESMRIAQEIEALSHAPAAKTAPSPAASAGDKAQLAKQERESEPG